MTLPEDGEETKKNLHNDKKNFITEQQFNRAKISLNNFSHI